MEYLYSNVAKELKAQGITQDDMLKQMDYLCVGIGSKKRETYYIFKK